MRFFNEDVGVGSGAEGECSRDGGAWVVGDGFGGGAGLNVNTREREREVEEGLVEEGWRRGSVMWFG